VSGSPCASVITAMLTCFPFRAASAREAREWVGMIEKARLLTIGARKNTNRRSMAESLRSDF
jgi:hypothetical protein